MLYLVVFVAIVIDHTEAHMRTHTHTEKGKVRERGRRERRGRDLTSSIAAHYLYL